MHTVKSPLVLPCLHIYISRADPGFFNRGGNQIIYDIEGGEPTNEASYERSGYKSAGGFEFRTPESESERNLTNYFIIFLLLFVTFLLRIFWKIFFMIIDLNLFQIFEDNNETINNITLILLL